MKQNQNESQNELIIIKRKVSAHAGSHSSAWKIALADFMTTLMIVFFVMWIINTVPPEEKKQIAYVFEGKKELNAGGENIMPNPIEKTDATSELTDITVGKPVKNEKSDNDKVISALYSSLKKDLDSVQKNVEITNKNERIQIQINDDNPLFDIGKSDVNPYFKELLAKIASAIKNKAVYVDIYGHTDNSPFLNGSNLELSVDRAINTAKELMQNNIPQDVITVHGEGFRNPIASNDTEQGRKKNRRTVIYIYPINDKKISADTGDSENMNTVNANQ